MSIKATLIKPEEHEYCNSCIRGDALVLISNITSGGAQNTRYCWKCLISLVDQLKEITKEPV